jgi:hypothetical protein
MGKNNNPWAKTTTLGVQIFLGVIQIDSECLVAQPSSTN